MNKIFAPKPLISLVLLGGLAVLGLQSCDFLRSGLSTTLNEQVETATGTAALSVSNWYYNGSAASDVSASADNTLAITFTKAATVDDSGVVGTFAISYSDADGVSTTRTVSSSGGSFSSDHRSYYLDMSPVTAFFDGASISGSTATVKITLSGFVCNEGDQAGSAIPKLEANLTVLPLFANDVDATLAFSTVYTTLGKSIAIPTNAKVSLDSTTDFAIAAANGTTLPAGFDVSSLGLGIASDGLSLIVVPTIDLMGQTFDVAVTINGIRGPGMGTSVSRTFTLSFNAVLITVDGVLDSNWSDSTIAASATDATDDAYAGGWQQTGCEASGMYVCNDGTYLYLAMTFDSLSNFWNSDRLVFLINKNGGTSGLTSQAGLDSSWSTPVSAFTCTNGSTDIFFFHNPGGSQGILSLPSESGADTTDSADNWTATPANWTCSTMGWTHGNAPAMVEYKIKLTAVGLSPGDVIKVFGIISNLWTNPDTFHATDIIPGSTPASSSSVDFDFSTALSYTIK